MKRDLIEIIPYQRTWQRQFQRAKKDLSRILGNICHSIEHIGSTSVTDLASKDRIDIQIGVKEISEDLCSRINRKMIENGFPKAFFANDHLPPNEFDENEWKKIYLKGINPKWDFKANIHIREVGAKNYNYALLFRDYLRQHPESAKAYAKFKIALAKHTHQDRDAYCVIKDPACDLIMINARNWMLTKENEH